MQFYAVHAFKWQLLTTSLDNYKITEFLSGEGTDNLVLKLTFVTKFQSKVPKRMKAKKFNTQSKSKILNRISMKQ